MTKTKNCITCGTEFSYNTKNNSRRVHCTPLCRSRLKDRKRSGLRKYDNPRIKSKICATCNTPFYFHVTGSGCSTKKYCSPECKNEAQRNRVFEICTNCSNLATRVGAGLCDACYCQLRRTGGFARRGAKLRGKNKYGYIYLTADHPLTGGNGRLYEHRKVVFDKIGEGPHPCFWCGKKLEWKTPPLIVIDHLNETKDDNRFENLVVSCSPCNRARGALLPFIRRMKSETLPTFITLVKNQQAQHAS